MHRTVETKFSLLPVIPSNTATPGFSPKSLSVPEEGRDYGGMRYDWNDRFGNSFNPRLAVVLQPLPSLYVKGLYGTSFVPPRPCNSTPCRCALMAEFWETAGSRIKGRRPPSCSLVTGQKKP